MQPLRRFAFDALDCETVGPERGPLSLRLHGHSAEGRSLLLDFSGAPRPQIETRRLTRVVVAAVEGAAGPIWSLQSDQGRFELGPVHLFVHEDVTARAAAAVPPRAVPLVKQLFWRLVFVLLATRGGRRWLERRAARA